jgi:hypothetical protein
VLIEKYLLEILCSEKLDWVVGMKEYFIANYSQWEWFYKEE